MNVTITPEQAAALKPFFALLGIDVDGDAPADQAPAQTAPVEPKADTYRVRTDRQKAASHKRIAAVNVRWGMKLAGIEGGRKVSDLTPAERTQYDAEIRACWTKPAGKTVKA